LGRIKDKESRKSFCKVFEIKTNKKHNRDDCFKSESNEVIGVFLRTLIICTMYVLSIKLNVSSEIEAG
jgi:hypothetical protein